MGSDLSTKECVVQTIRIRKKNGRFITPSQTKNGTPEGVPLICGEYRSRTDDLLHAMQAL